MAVEENGNSLKFQQPLLLQANDNYKITSNSQREKKAKTRNTGTFFQIFASVIGAFTAMSNGMTLGWTAPLIPYFVSEDSHIKMTQNQAEWLETSLFIGSIVGLPTTMYLVDRIGRKNSLLVSTFVSSAGWILIAAADKVEYLYAARFGQGIANELAVVGYLMYIAEIADKNRRGFLSSVLYLMALIGVLIMYSVGPFVAFYVPSLIAVTFLFTEGIVFSLFLPESPYYLVFKGKKVEAVKSLQKFRSTVSIAPELKEIVDAIEQQEAQRGRPQDIILVKSNRRALCTVTVLVAAQQFGGFQVIKMNLHEILESAGSIYLESTSAAILFSVLTIAVIVAASFTVDRFGRKTLLLASSILSGMCLLTLAVYFNVKNGGFQNIPAISWIPTAAVLIFALVFEGGLGMCPIIVEGEIFSSEVKAIGMTLAETVYVSASLAALQVFLSLKSFGMHVPFYIFSACLFVNSLFVIFYMPETKGKTLNEIQLILKGEKLIEKQKDDISTNNNYYSP